MGLERGMTDEARGAIQSSPMAIETPGRIAEVRGEEFLSLASSRPPPTLSSPRAHRSRFVMEAGEAAVGFGKLWFHRGVAKILGRLKQRDQCTCVFAAGRSFQVVEAMPKGASE